MKTTVTFSDFRQAFKAIRPDNFSHEGLEQLWEYFESYERDTGEEIELDVIAICCERGFILHRPHNIPGIEQLTHQGLAKQTGCTGNEYTH